MTPDRHLSPYVLAEIVERFGCRPEQMAEGQARFPLLNCTATAQIAREHGNWEEVPVQVVDLAVGGLGFKARVPVAAGIQLSIRFSAPGLRGQTWACRVVNVYSFDGTHYHAGAYFETIRMEQCPVALSEPPGTPPWHRRRAVIGSVCA